MKNLFLSLFALLAFGQSIWAQQQFNNGTITYGISIESDNAMANSMFEGSYMRIAFKDEQARVDIAMGNGIMDMVTVVTPKKGMLLVSTTLGNKKMACKLDKDDLKNLEEEQAKKPKVKKEDIEILRNQRLTVSGYDCYLVRVKNPEFEEPMDIYVTDDIKPKKQTQVQQQFPGVTGMPLQYSFIKNGMTIVFKAKEISPGKIDKDAFKIKIPEGYEIKTYEEFKAMGAGQAGGFGM